MDPGVDVPEARRSTQMNALEEELKREREKVRALQDIGAALTSTLGLNELLQLLVSRISRVMDAERTTLYLVDESQDELWSKIAQGDRLTEIRLRIGDGVAGWVAMTGKALNIDRAYEDPRFNPSWDQRFGYQTRTILCVPMKNQHGRIVGVVQVLNKRQDRFSEEDEALLTALGAQASVSIENSKLFLSMVRKNAELLDTQAQLERKLQHQDVLLEIAAAAARAMRLQDLLDEVLHQAIQAVHAAAGSVVIASGTKGDLTFRQAQHDDKARTERLQIASGEGLCGWVAQKGEAVIVDAATQDKRYSAALAKRLRYRPKRALCVPLRWEGGQGALTLLDKGHGLDAFDTDDLKLAQLIAGQVATAIGLAQHREQRSKQERLTAVGQFLASVLHDLRTPMTVISGYAQLMRDEDDSDKRRLYAENVQKQVRFINKLTGETLAFARGESKLWVRKVYLYKFFEELAVQLRHSLPDPIEVVLELHDRGVAYFDEDKIIRVVHNLAKNAAEAIKTGKGRFTLHIERGADGQLCWRFIDTGPGIAPAAQAQLFDSFATHGKGGGSGLGLAIVKKAIDDHGGQIHVESRPGWTEFRIELPQPPEQPAP
ncbi:MAG: GAF domain-containing protein [Polyangiales bacterium]